MVRIPSYRARNVQSQLVIEQKHGRKLVRHDLRRMEMAGVNQAQDVVFHRVIHVELVGADRIGFHADPEYLGLNGNINLASVIRNCKNPVQ